MLAMKILGFCLLALLQLGAAFVPHSAWRGSTDGHTSSLRIITALNARGMPPLVPEPVNPKKSSSVTEEDMERFTSLLTSFAGKLDNQPEEALTLASGNVEWLLSRNLPAMAQRLLDDVPQMRQDKGAMKAYSFLMDFVEAVSNEMTSYVSKHQGSMRMLLEAASKGEAALNATISDNLERLTDPGFLVYVDSELDGAAKGTPAADVLVTVRLRLLELVGEGLSPDVAVLPRLLSEETLEGVQRATLGYLRDFSTPGKELFLLNLRLLQKEMGRKYESVDPELLERMTQIEQVVEASMKDETYREEKNEMQ